MHTYNNVITSFLLAKNTKSNKKSLLRAECCLCADEIFNTDAVSIDAAMRVSRVMSLPCCYSAVARCESTIFYVYLFSLTTRNALKYDASHLLSNFVVSKNIL